MKTIAISPRSAGSGGGECFTAARAMLQAPRRGSSATLMNATSSRSHAVFLITVETAEAGDDGKSHIRVGKLNLVDLAGCAACARVPPALANASPLTPPLPRAQV